MSVLNKITSLLDKNGRKVLYIAALAVFIIMGGVSGSLYMLRSEAVDTHMKLAALHASTFADQLEQTVTALDYTLDTFAATKGGDYKTEELQELLENSPFIRSVGILDENGKIVADSNPSNINLTILTKNFFPVPAFEEPILRFSSVWEGRGFYDGHQADKKTVAADAITFLPIIKQFQNGKNSGYIVVTLNTEYFQRKYKQNLPINTGYVDIYLIDGSLLFSTDPTAILGKIDPNIKNLLSKGRDATFVEENNDSKESLMSLKIAKNYPLAVCVRLPYDKTLAEWERQRKNVLAITATLVILSVTLALLLFIRSKEQQRLEDGILKSKMAAKGEMISMIAHQWRQPLAALSVILANIQDAHKYNELTDEYLNETATQANSILKQLSKTIDDFRRFFKPEGEKKSFCLCVVAHESTGLIFAELLSKNVRVYINGIEKNIAAEPVCDISATVIGYRNEFVQVLIALLQNSYEAIEKSGQKDGKIYIDIEPKDKTCTLTIKDNGGGITEEIMGQIFEPYFSTKTEKNGTGMGLYMAKTVIEKTMDGQISTYNTYEGAVFCIELPKAQNIQIF
jgi:signal transduction histidine kinase